MSNHTENDIFQSILTQGKQTDIPASAEDTPAPLVSQSNENNDISAFPNPCSHPTQNGPLGIKYDFNYGVRVSVPDGNWNVICKDIDTKTIILSHKGSNFTIQGKKRYFINTRIECFLDNILVFSHNYNAKDQPVAIMLAGDTLGDSVGWFPYAYRFFQQHNCHLTVMLSSHMKDLLEPSYPDVRFIVKNDFQHISSDFYATYYIGLFFQDDDNISQPTDFRMVGLHRTAGYILGVSPDEERPNIHVSDTRPLDEPYVVIAVQASMQCKYWNNPHGWHDVINFIKSLGYRVICIDRDMAFGHELHWNLIPYNAEDQTGLRPLKERAQWLKHAEFFIGLSSGLSWLAWAMKTPVVMISGFTHPVNEFYTPHRIFNANSCNSCWHDVRHTFQHYDFTFCPKHKGTERQFECTRDISSDYVIQHVKKLLRV